MSASTIVTHTGTLRSLQRAGWIEWDEHARDRHWTGQTARRLWVRAGARLVNRWDRFEHRGRAYKLEYFDGCFHPFVVRVDDPALVRPSFV